MTQKQLKLNGVEITPNVELKSIVKSDKTSAINTDDINPMSDDSTIPTSRVVYNRTVEAANQAAIQGASKASPESMGEINSVSDIADFLVSLFDLNEMPNVGKMFIAEMSGSIKVYMLVSPDDERSYLSQYIIHIPNDENETPYMLLDMASCTPVLWSITNS